MILQYAALVFAAVLLAWVSWSITQYLGGKHTHYWFDPNTRCRNVPVSCGAVTTFFTPLLSLALGFTIFVLYRLRWVLAPYLRTAKQRPHETVPTAGQLIDRIVGRDELCNVTIDDLHEHGRRPRVIVGGVGTGKTAVLVLLTQMLAERGAVPVAIRLRDAGPELDFGELAYRRFKSELAGRVASEAEADKAWRRLYKHRRIVVLADGLEEALVGTESQGDRDNLIRRAILRATKQDLPLVVASRPHDPLRGMGANITELEPLSEEAALEYVGQHSTTDDARIKWIVETAEVAEAPLYLQITKELHVLQRLHHLSPGEQATGQLNSRSADRAGLRWRLLDTWQSALLDGHVADDLPLNRQEREVALEQLGALACVGLLTDTLVIDFADLVGSPAARPPAPANGQAGKAVAHPDRALAALYSALEDRLRQMNERVDVRLAATHGGQLGLVDSYGQGVRFHHSLMQAYLGSRFLDHVIAHPDEYSSAFRAPSREFLIALTLYSRECQEAVGAAADTADNGLRRWRSPRWRPGAATSAPPHAAGPAVTDTVSTWHESPRAQRAREAAGRLDQLVDRLRQAATARTQQVKRPDAKVLDLYRAAFEIDCVTSVSRHAAIAREVAGIWPQLNMNDVQISDSALELIRAWGRTARTITARYEERREGGQSVPKPPAVAYDELYGVACSESRYDARLAAAQEIGRGSDAAYNQVADDLRAEFTGNQSTLVAADGSPGKRPGHTRLFGATDANDMYRRSMVCAWLLPLLVGSLRDAGKRADAAALLSRAVERVGSRKGMERDDVLQTGEEIALAQGFKHAANRRYRLPRRRAEMRNFLADQALEMLHRSHYWFSQLTLIHALCLWALPDDDIPPATPAGHKSNPEAVAQQWVDDAGSEYDGVKPRQQRDAAHPLVAAAAVLAAQAIETRRPDRYIWIDESGIVNRVGSHLADDGQRRAHGLWIAPSTGWSSLHPRAQQLVADVLLLQNLADRGDRPRDRESHLRRADRLELPPCLDRDRAHLDPRRGLGSAVVSQPGWNCVDGCRFRLCPHPPKGLTSQATVELSEAFCRRQRALVKRRQGRSLWYTVPPWQNGQRRGLIDFWDEMEERARR